MQISPIKIGNASEIDRAAAESRPKASMFRRQLIKRATYRFHLACSNLFPQMPLQELLAKAAHLGSCIHVITYCVTFA